MAAVTAIHQFARISPTKVRPFADLIRGKTAGQGLHALAYEPNRGARFLEKVLRSAIANAEDRGVRNPDRLKISEARVDGGPMFKRVHARARGMANLIRRRTAHIHVSVDAPELG
ncbi:MAG: 50S ribosomal protein L22 [Planctomycetia bacterium]|jgi:large subunit ribosomal protein L22